jgi:threonine dehydrogenase-like Zn-dependent dehydrogenase
LGPKDIEGKRTYSGNMVWKNPQIRIKEKPIPDIADDEVLVKVRAVGICGTDIHMAQADNDGYISYPGLTAFPVTIGHEFAGEILKRGSNAINKRTNKQYEAGEPICAEEMYWCGFCKPCCDGYPNHCENLEEMGITTDGAFANYIKVKAKYCWSLRPLKNIYSGDDIFIAGSLVEPTSVAYNALIERGGGIRPGDSVVILGGGPIGLAAVAIMKKNGAANIILSEPSESRCKLAREMGANYIINPLKENFVEKVLSYTDGMGAALYLEATGLPDLVFKDIEEVIWNGRALNATVVIVARTATKIPLTGEVFQVRRANIVGTQGHSGHGNFTRVISLMADGMDMTKISTKRIRLGDVPDYLIKLQTNKEDCKVTAIL